MIEWNEQSLVDCTAEEVEQILEMDDSLDLHIVLSRLWYVNSSSCSYTMNYMNLYPRLSLQY